MSNWKKVKVSDVCDVRDGTHESPKAKESGFYLLTSKNFSNGAVNFEKAQLISEYDFNIINKRSKVEIGDIVMPMIGTIGSPVLIVSEPNFAIKNVALFKTSNSQINASYLLRFLGSNLFFKYLESCSRGGTQKFVSLTDLRNIPIPIPPLEEQKRIAEILDKADELRRLRQESIKKLNTLSQSIFYEMFGDPDVNPYGFSKGVIGDLLEETQYGTSAKAGAIGSFPILRMGNISIDGKIYVESLKYIDLEDKEIEKFTVKDGDILFNRTNSPDLVGKTAVYYGDETYAFAGYLVRARVNKLAVPEYVSMYLNSSHGKKVLRNMCKAIVGMANINAQELKKIRILKPPVELQIEFQKKLIAIQKYFPEQSSSSIEMETLFQSLQHRAFNGEL